MFGRCTLTFSSLWQLFQGRSGPRIVKILVLIPIILLGLGGCITEDESALGTWVEDWRDEVIYQIMVDRFENGSRQNDVIGKVGVIPGDLSRFQGGDWIGIINRLDYLEHLGVTTIWLSPVVKNLERTADQDGYHGYWALDFTQTNPHFGTLTELQKLVNAAHKRKMKVLIDLVVNHTGRLFYYDINADGHLQPGELEPIFSPSGPVQAKIGWLTPKPRFFWDPPDGDGQIEPEVISLDERYFHRRGQTSDYTSRYQKLYGDFPTGLRDLNTENDDVLKALVDTSLYWIILTDIDGFRLDAVPHVPHLFWRRFSQKLRRALDARGKRQFFLLGEIYDGDPAFIASYIREGNLDAAFDFPFKWEVIDAYILDGFPATTAVKALEQNRGYYPAAPHPLGIQTPPWQARVLLADNHDMQRIRRELDDPLAAELAMTMVFTVGGIPSIYYGTEQELKGSWGNASREVLWESGFHEDTRMFRHIAKLSAIRRQYRALRRGSLVIRFASPINARKHGPGVGLLAWERISDDDRVLVATNAHPIDAAQARVPTGFSPGTKLVDLLGAISKTLVIAEDGTVLINIPPRRAAILAPR